MTIVEILKLVMVLLTGLFGIAALLQPQRVAESAFLGAGTANGAAEIRASWGGLFLGLAAAVLLLRSPDAYLVLGISYAGIALVRVINWGINRTLINRTVIFILIFEIVSAVILLLPESVS